MMHGFAGYFESQLYKDVMISIHPETHSPGMFSWFPIYFPIKVTTKNGARRKRKDSGKGKMREATKTERDGERMNDVRDRGRPGVWERRSNPRLRYSFTYQMCHAHSTLSRTDTHLCPRKFKGGGALLAKGVSDKGTFVHFTPAP